MAEDFSRIPAALDPAWGERVREAILDQLGRGLLLTNGARAVRSWSAVEQGRPVVYVVYRHPWWDFLTGLRAWADEPNPIVPAEEQTPELVADWLTELSIGEPLGTVSHDMVPDGDGVWWWGSEPLPGDHDRRGPAPRPPPPRGGRIQQRTAGGKRGPVIRGWFGSLRLGGLLDPHGDDGPVPGPVPGRAGEVDDPEGG